MGQYRLYRYTLFCVRIAIHFFLWDTSLRPFLLSSHCVTHAASQLRPPRSLTCQSTLLRLHSSGANSVTLSLKLTTFQTLFATVCQKRVATNLDTFSGEIDDFLALYGLAKSRAVLQFLSSLISGAAVNPSPVSEHSEAVSLTAAPAERRGEPPLNVHMLSVYKLIVVICTERCSLFAEPSASV